MAWSYSGDPSASMLDQVRFLIGDTNESEQHLSDAEIQFAINATSNAVAAAVLCCSSLIAKYSAQTSFKLGPMAVNNGERVAHFRELMAELRRNNGINVDIYLGNIDTSAETLDQNLPRPAFTRDLMDNT